MLADIVIFGTIWGAIYTVLALGFTLIFGVARILNRPYGAMYLVASSLIYSLVSQFGMRPVPAWLLAVAATPVAGMALYRLFIYPLRESLARVLIVTAGIAIFLQEVAVLVYSTEPRYVPTAISGSFAIMHVRVTYQQLVTIVVALDLVFALNAFLVRRRLGLTL